MRKPLLILIAAAILFAVLGVTAAVFLNKASVEAPPPGGNLFGEAPDVPAELQKEEVVIVLADGTQAYVPDFISEEQPEVASAVNGFQVAGDATAAYQILYFPQQSYFLMSLLSEPLGETRLAAETELRSKLGMLDEKLCALNADVRTSNDVNETYAGRNLGLSFCPGAVQLP